MYFYLNTKTNKIYTEEEYNIMIDKYLTEKLSKLNITEMANKEYNKGLLIYDGAWYDIYYGVYMNERNKLILDFEENYCELDEQIQKSPIIKNLCTIQGIKI